MAGRTKALLRAALLLGSLSATACGNYSDGPFQTNQGSVRTLRTQADSRLLVVSTPARVDPTGVVTPHQISCAEPSPDVAKAVQAASSLGAAANVNATEPQSGSQVAVAAALALANARAEAIAQLGERLPTVQLLRDVLFRACEAYSMGALGSISYAMMLSRIGSVIVTLMGSEMAAGSFGRELAAIGGQAGASGRGGLEGAALDPAGRAAAAALVARREDELAVLAQRRRDAQRALDNLPSAADEKTRLETDQALADAVAQERTKRAELTRAQAELDRLPSAAATSSADATALRAGGRIPGRPATTGADTARVIAGMQQAYMDAADLSPVILACVTALQRVTEIRPAPAGTPGPQERRDLSPVVLADQPNDLLAYTRFARVCEGGILREAIAAAGNAAMAAEQRRSAAAAAELARALNGLDPQVQRDIAAAFRLQTGQRR